MSNKKNAAAACEWQRDEDQGILYISSGLPGAGKSTFLKKHKANNEVIISRDEIRFSVLKDGEDYFSHEEEVFHTFVQRIVENITAGTNVYADATHLTPSSQLKLLAHVLMEASPAQINYIHFNTPLNICLERNELRKGTIAYCPPEVIRKMRSYAYFHPCSYIDNAWEVDIEGKVSKRK